MNTIEDYNLLTIIIPTYNRCDDLRTCLDYVVPQVEQNKNRVHIYISDNASTDDTKIVVKEYIDKYPEMITYYCQPRNLTASPNFDHAVHHVNSEYIYMLSDDDIIVPGFISLILAYIDKYPNVNYYYLNRYFADMNMCNAYLYNTHLTMDYITLYENGGELIKNNLDGPSCISANIFKKEVWTTAAKYIKEDCPGYVWLSILFHGVIHTKNVAVINYPMFTARMPIEQRYSVNWPWYCVKGLGQLFSYLDRIYPGIYDAWIQRQQKEGRRQFMMMLCSVASDKKLYRERAGEIKPFIRSGYIRVLYDALVTIIPEWFAMKILKNIFRAFKLFNYIR